MKRRQVRTSTPRLGFGMFVATLLLFAAGVTGCSKVDDPDALPSGKYPIAFTAAVDGLTAAKAATRATVDNSLWIGNGTEKVAISIDEGSTNKVYRVKNTNGDMEPDSPNDAYYWKDKDPLNITAWYPADFNITSIKNQNEGDTYAKLDFLHATHSNLAFNNTASLTFTHRMAKATATLQAGIGLMDGDLNGAVVQFYGYTSATVSLPGGTLTNPSSSDWITAKSSGNTYSALLIPQTSFPANTPFLRVSVGGRTYLYTPNIGDGDTQAGRANSYTITVNRTGIDVSMNGWSNMGSDITGTNDDNPMVISVRGENISNVAVTHTSSGNNTNQFTYALTETNVPVLTFTVNDHKWVSDIRIDGVVDSQYKFDGNTRMFSYTLSNINTDVNITISTDDIVSATPKVGDYVYPDRICTIEELFLEPAGIVYKVDETNLYVVARTSGGYLWGYSNYSGAIANRAPAIANCAWNTTNLEAKLREIFTIQENNQDAGWPSKWSRLSGYHWYADEGPDWLLSLSKSDGNGWTDGQGHFDKGKNQGANTRAFCVVPINSVRK